MAMVNNVFGVAGAEGGLPKKSVFVGNLARQLESQIKRPVLGWQLPSKFEIYDRVVGGPGSRDVDGGGHGEVDG